MDVPSHVYIQIYSDNGFILQILMNVWRTVMVVSRCVQTLIALFSVPVEMVSVLAVI